MERCHLGKSGAVEVIPPVGRTHRCSGEDPLALVEQVTWGHVHGWSDPPTLVEQVTWGHVHEVSHQLRKTHKGLGSTPHSMDSSETAWTLAGDTLKTRRRLVEDSPDQCYVGLLWHTLSLG